MDTFADASRNHAVKDAHDRNSLSSRAFAANRTYSIKVYGGSVAQRTAFVNAVIQARNKHNDILDSIYRLQGELVFNESVVLWFRAATSRSEAEEFVLQIGKKTMGDLFTQSPLNSDHFGLWAD